MATARWSLRLPRGVSNLHHTGAVPGRVNSRLRPELAPLSQRRWLQKPPPQDRPWASRPGEPKKDDSQNENQDKAIQEGESQPEQAQQPGRNAQLATALAEADTSDLVTEVHIPDGPNAILPPDHPALSILGNSSLVIQRQIEMMNIIIGMEQANRYVIMDGQGQTLGYIAEKDHGLGSAFARQMFKTHRSFTTHIFDRQEREVLRIHRPFAYINSRIRIYDPVPEGGYADMETSTALQGTSANSVVNQGAVSQVSPLNLEEMRIIGEAQQRWAPLRRKYDLFSYRPIEAPRDENLRIESGEKPTSDTIALTESKAPDQAIEAGMVQFAHVNEPFLSWDFTLKGEDQNTIGSVNRNFVGFAREIFTDTGVYALRMDSAAQTSALQDASGQEVARHEREAAAMTLDQRAVMLATAVSIDFDYFSRHSSVGGGGFMPIFWPMGGGAAEGGAAGAGAGAAGGAAEGAGAMEGAAGTAGRGLGGAAGAGSEGAIAGAGTMAGYEAMQRGASGQRGGDDASPTNNEPFGAGQSPEHSENRPGADDVWGENDDPWGGGGGGPPSDGPPPGMGGEGGDGGGGGGGWADVISDFFGD
ncbi:Phospholipid scramblase family protein [Fulvia fulva]|uniref:Phospholipid scramblase family protein n=1 Tax=Passalora fulva TaxID=5499 RepID=A0A9Q8PBD5_PASFU|nr:Phospholipid scramblase family protein [Fulvia fulva]KAK4621521.1 Phospholipid scramblase family protein [Fulvia fulva]KAK4622659.1 Phospholipid scramblase family protein [Fulvia fulva]UJO19356.1 Phospholipid scramblase family protein [Fulvia fulva]WPV16556.1 Phospholipid scramblase family protein [Fulvia fulva]WPV31466.1 Phospholipid scramblase family protein [Fulvia fulva]